MFYKLSFLLTVNSSKDTKLFIRNLSGIMVENWKLANDWVNKQQVENPIEIDESIVRIGKVSNFGTDMEYMFDCDNKSGNEKQSKNRNNNSELEDNSQGENKLKSNGNE